MREEGVGHVLEKEGGGIEEVEGYSFWALWGVSYMHLFQIKDKGVEGGMASK